MYRDTARVLPVDHAGRVLLMHGWDPAVPDRPFWFTIGGGREGAETLSEAAVRELFEETGIRADTSDLGEPFAKQQSQFDWNGMTLMQCETYFAVAATTDVVSFDRMEQIERDTTDRAGWWTPDDLDRDGTAASPRLTEFMRIAVMLVRSRTES